MLPADFFYSDQLCGTLSGGEKVKLQIAALQMGSPDIYLLDEPSNDIDIETLEWLEHLDVYKRQVYIRLAIFLDAFHFTADD